MTKDIPDWSVAVGNPCRVVKKITEEDKQYYFKDRKFDDEAWEVIKDLQKRKAFLGSHAMKKLCTVSIWEFPGMRCRVFYFTYAIGDRKFCRILLWQKNCESYFGQQKMPRAGIEPATRGFSVLCSTN